ncbi:MAG: LysR family transcriptional regulator [Lachnospiraceae bacterium]|nr:LysR family transcriptional regulator [Lachnospiraceae bacterium]
MIEIKQLKYFVVTADVGSFSEAAKLLYTTQSSVSKVIIGLEKELGYSLFDRNNKKIELTVEGRAFFERASKLVNEFDNLENESAGRKSNRIHIGMNHSSWLANCFSDFFKLHEDEDVCYCLHTDTTLDIVERVRMMVDEVGVVYVFPEDRMQFNYLLKKYQLKFECIKSVGGMIYFNPEDKNSDNSIHPKDVNSLKYIQNEQDDFITRGKWQTPCGRSVNVENNISVITNSDYIMQAMLKENGLANLSADSFNNYYENNRPGLKLENAAGTIEFGVVLNEKRKISDQANAFILYIKNVLCASQAYNFASLQK